MILGGVGKLNLSRRYLIPALFMAGFFIFIPNLTQAHPGNTASDGCHYCRTNCSSWGYITGTRHCHGGGSPSYSSPSYSSPSYSSPSYSSTPSCPSMSSYSYLSESCECYSGYIVSNGSCISGSSYCRDKYGYYSSYDSISKACECDRGYFFENGIYGEECVSGDSQCRDDYGIMSNYDTLTGKCKCSYGYIFGEDFIGRTQCITTDDYCENKFGYNSGYNSLSDSCECNYGYELSYKTFGSGYECKSCTSKYGIHSKYNSLAKECECKDGYTLKDGKCEEKHNSAYFTLKEIDEDNRQIIVESEYNFQNYLIDYGIGCFSGTMNWYLNDRIVINMGTDFYVDIFDKIILQDDNEVCDILDVEIVDDGYVLGVEENIYIPITIIKTTGTIETQKTFLEKEKELLGQIDLNLSDRLKGKILLQVEDHGEAWYVHYNSGKRYYMANGNEAYNIMRYLGVGITNKDLEKIKADKDFAKKNSGKIFLQVEANGEAYYIDSDGDNHYLKNGEAAYNVMRDLGLGIINNDLRKIDIEEDLK